MAWVQASGHKPAQAPDRTEQAGQGQEPERLPRGKLRISLKRRQYL